MSRVIGWFSCGAPSAVAVKLAIAEHPEVEVVRIDTGSEHPDNARFIADCEAWYGQEIIQLRAADIPELGGYKDTWDVWDRTGWLKGPAGTRCSPELKKRVREWYQRPYDLHVWGYAAEPSNEVKRANNLAANEPGLSHAFPLIDHGVPKPETLGIVERAGIALPVMYELGYRNNNCIGCVHAGIGEWNMIRRDFPDVFDRMAKKEREVEYALHREGDHVPGRPAIWLDELDPDRGDIRTDPEVSCSLNCAAVEAIAEASPTSPTRSPISVPSTTEEGQ